VTYEESKGTGRYWNLLARKLGRAKPSGITPPDLPRLVSAGLSKSPFYVRHSSFSRGATRYSSARVLSLSPASSAQDVLDEIVPLSTHQRTNSEKGFRVIGMFKSLESALMAIQNSLVEMFQRVEIILIKKRRDFQCGAADVKFTKSDTRLPRRYV